jgi:hypothetical protein
LLREPVDGVLEHAGDRMIVFRRYRRAAACRAIERRRRDLAGAASRSSLNSGTPANPAQTLDAQRGATSAAASASDGCSCRRLPATARMLRVDV